MCSANGDKPPTAFLPIQGLDALYTWGYKSETSRDDYVTALIGIQTAFVNNEQKTFQTASGEETQKRAKWRNRKVRPGSLLAPTLGWVLVAREAVDSVSSEELSKCLETTATSFASHESVASGLEPVLCDSQEELDRIVTELGEVSLGNVPKGQKKPRVADGQSVGYARDARVVAWVLTTAAGVCESCDNTAPFVKSNGAPFLEVHHVKHLSDGGSDTVTNAVGLCPNCHRELHFGQDNEAKKQELYQTVSRLIEE